jgi:hypothetical protein
VLLVFDIVLHIGVRCKSLAGQTFLKGSAEMKITGRYRASRWGQAVAHLVEALQYMPDGRWFNSQLEFFIDFFLPAALWPYNPFSLL